MRCAPWESECSLEGSGVSSGWQTGAFGSPIVVPTRAAHSARTCGPWKHDASKDQTKMSFPSTKTRNHNLESLAASPCMWRKRPAKIPEAEVPPPDPTPRGCRLPAPKSGFRRVGPSVTYPCRRSGGRTRARRSGSLVAWVALVLQGHEMQDLFLLGRRSAS
jgi:hypothetical protein